MQFFIFFWGKTIFLFKCPEKTGIVFKSVGVESLTDITSAKEGIAAHVQSFLGNVLVNGQPKILFENMGNMEFAHIELSCQFIQ